MGGVLLMVQEVTPGGFETFALTRVTRIVKPDVALVHRLHTHRHGVTLRKLCAPRDNCRADSRRFLRRGHSKHLHGQFSQPRMIQFNQ